VQVALLVVDRFLPLQDHPFRCFRPDYATLRAVEQRDACSLAGARSPHGRRRRISGMIDLMDSGRDAFCYGVRVAFPDPSLLQREDGSRISLSGYAVNRIMVFQEQVRSLFSR
jgi:hypothetical protein